MHTSYLLLGAAGLVPALVAAQHPEMLKRGVNCSFATSPDRGATCESFASSWGLSVEELQKLNPGVSCPNIAAGQDYCVIGEVTADPTTTIRTAKPTTSTTTKVLPPSTTLKTTTAPGPSNTPAMPGIAKDCDKFYKVSSGDTCDAIARKNSITVAQFRSWNSEIDANCANLWLDYYVCVHTPGAAATTLITSKAPEPTNTAPQPQMPGIVSNCDKFYKVSSGDTCDAIARKNSISVAQFRSWNSEIDANCANLWLDYYVCVHTPGAAATTLITSKAPEPTNTAPQPQMPGIVPNCKKFYKIKSGDGCWAIAQAAGISLAQFFSYNTAVDSNCSNIWLDYYVCIGV